MLFKNQNFFLFFCIFFQNMVYYYLYLKFLRRFLMCIDKKESGKLLLAPIRRLARTLGNSSASIWNPVWRVFPTVLFLETLAIAFLTAFALLSIRSTASMLVLRDGNFLVFTRNATPASNTSKGSPFSVTPF